MEGCDAILVRLYARSKTWNRRSPEVVQCRYFLRSLHSRYIERSDDDSLP
jgi:hypothetical protein